MNFKVIKLFFDGIVVESEKTCSSVQELLDEIHFRNKTETNGNSGESVQKWANSTVDKMKGLICNWASSAQAGDELTLSASAIVSVGDTVSPEEGVCPQCRKADLIYERVTYEEGKLVQESSCEACSKRWKDIFSLTERKELSK